MFTVLPRMIAESQLAARHSGTATASEGTGAVGEELGTLELGAGKVMDYSVDFSQQALDAEVDPLAGLLDDEPVQANTQETTPAAPDPEHDLDRLLDGRREASRPGLERGTDIDTPMADASDSSGSESSDREEEEEEDDDDSGGLHKEMSESLDRMAKAVSSGDKTAGSMPHKRSTVRDHLAIMLQEFGVQLDAGNVQPFQANKLMPHKALQLTGLLLSASHSMEVRSVASTSQIILSLHTGQLHEHARTHGAPIGSQH